MRIVVLAIVLAAGTAAAQPPGETPPLPEPPQKSIEMAYLVTVAAVAGPSVIGAAISYDDDGGTRDTVGGMIATAGLVIGPTAGHWYAGRVWTTGLTLRVGAAALIAAMVIKDEHERLDVGEIVVGMTAAVSLWGTGFVWDLVTVPSAVRRYNRAHAIVIAPTPNGIAVAGSF